MHFSSAPAIVPAYARILLARKPQIVTGTVPRMEAVLERFSIDPGHLARYRRICGNHESDTLPIAYPHILAAPVHLALIASDPFPVNLFGVVHVRNHIVQQRPLGVGERGQIRAWMEGHRETSRGQELDLWTEVSIGSETVWSEIATLLTRKRSRVRTARSEGNALPDVSAPPGSEVTSSAFDIEPGVGRRYARVSGDFNPIHIADLAARFFGFKHAIAHGMWSLARCAAEIGGPAFARPCTLDVAFKRPIAFCSRIVLESWMAQGRVGFRLRDAETDRGHLLGCIAPT